MIGKTISHYKILEKLGEGGMGVVYKAEDTKLKRVVALKFLPPGLDAHEPERARFLQEAQAAAALNHPNICTIHDVVVEKDPQFIVMEFVEGKTLRQMVPLPKIQDCIGYATQIGEALQEAHSKGVVHRDVKTDNIMVNDKNQIKVADFGLAKLKGSLKLTKASSTVGTLSYMSPEQIQGNEADGRSDIFSFGVVLYEMLTGRLPFQGDYEAAMVYSIVNEKPEPIQKHLPEVSSELVHIINRALEKNPEDRYQNVHDMVIDLRRVKKETSRVSRVLVKPPSVEEGQGFVSEEQRTAATIRRKKAGRTLLFTGLASVLVLVVVIALFTILRSHAPKLNPDMTFRTIEVPFTQINYPGFSGDGQWVSFPARDVNNEWSIYFMNVSKGNPLRLTKEPIKVAMLTDVSPDASEILYDRNTPSGMKGIYLVPSSGGTGRKIAEPAYWGKWHPNGLLIGYIRSGSSNVPGRSGRCEFWTVNRDGTENRLVFVDSVGYGGNLSFDWSPDGNSIAWLRSFPDYGEIFIRDLKSGKERQLTSYKKVIDEIEWALNGQILFTTNKGGNTNVWMIPSGGGEAVQITRGPGPDIAVKPSADCRRLLFLEQRSTSTLWTVDRNGNNARQLTFDNQYLEWPSFLPDLKRISFDMASSDRLQTINHIYIIQNDGTNRTQVTTGEALYYNADWSPDGKYMSYASSRADEPVDSSRIFLVDIENPQTPRRLCHGIGVRWINQEKFVVVNPHALSHPYTALYSIYSPEPISVSADSTNEYPLPDGRHIVMSDSRKGREGWWIKTEEAEPIKILPLEYLDYSITSASLRYILYLKPDGEVWRVSIPQGKHEKLPDILNGINPQRNIDMSFDDRQLVFTKGRLDARLVLIENVFK